MCQNNIGSVIHCVNIINSRVCFLGIGSDISVSAHTVKRKRICDSCKFNRVCSVIGRNIFVSPSDFHCILNKTEAVRNLFIGKRITFHNLIFRKPVFILNIIRRINTAKKRFNITVIAIFNSSISGCHRCRIREHRLLC